MAVLFQDKLIFQTSRPDLLTVRWKKVTIVAGAPVDVTAWSTTGVVEVLNGNYYIVVPIEDTDPDPTIIVVDTGDGSETYTRAVVSLGFSPQSLLDVQSGGGVLFGRIGASSLSPENYLEIVQGEEKLITFVVEAIGRFDLASAGEISVRIKDPRGNAIEIDNESIERTCEELDVQVIRAAITAEDSMVLQSGVARIEIQFDNQKAVLKHHLKIIEDIEIEIS